MSAKEGERVVAIAEATDTQVKIYGYGVYEGQKEAPFGPMGMALEDYKHELEKMGMEYRPHLNARIRLDNGTVVWGAACWWGPESGFEEWTKGREVVLITNGEQDEKDTR